MKVVFRTDASSLIGTGHVRRCLTLANALRLRSVECHFICREHPGNLLALIRNQGFEVTVLPVQLEPLPVEADDPVLDHAAWLGGHWSNDADQTANACVVGKVPDWVIVDHYALDARWEKALRPHCRNLMVIDDLADRPHDCDLLLDQNLVADMTSRYAGRLPSRCGLMLGPYYALLQPEYVELRPLVQLRQGPINRMMIYFGGADGDNLTGMTISAFLSLGRRDIVLDVVISPESLHTEAIRQQVAGHPQVCLHGILPSLAPLMVEADLAIGAGGGTTWERCCLGLPTLVITLAENQKPIAAELGRQGLIRWLGHKSEVSPTTLAHAFKDILEQGLNPAWSERCQELVDGRGVERVVSILSLDPGSELTARLACLDDEALILRWANDPLVRQNSFSTDMIDQATHRTWFRKRLRDPEHCRFYVIETNDGFPMGQVRFERSDQVWEVHYAMDAGFRGRGIGFSFLKTALLAFKAIPSNQCKIIGHVKPENKASRRIFIRLGFAETHDGDELIYCRTI